MGFSIWHLLVVLLVVLVVFGAGRLPGVMGDLGKGIRNFKAGMGGANDDNPKSDPSQASLPPSDKNPDKPA